MGFTRQLKLMSGVGLVLMASSDAALAFTVAISAAAKTVYLQVGVGTFTGGTTCNYYLGMPSVPSCFLGGGTPSNNSTINTVSATLTGAQVLNGAQSMSTNSTVTQSSYDGYVYCTAGQLYIGSFYRNTTNTGDAILTATVPGPLTGSANGTLPFSQISWVSNGLGDQMPESTFPSGTFVNSGSQTIGTVAVNHWAESCWAFSYANTALVSAGTFTGTVTYTLTTP